MLEHLPGWLGTALHGMRAGASGLAIVQPGLGDGFATIELSSPAFADQTQLPVRFTADGAGISPPLYWGAVPPGTAHLALIVEDPDAPTPAPLVHAIVWGLPGGADQLPEGAIARDGDHHGSDGVDNAGVDVGRNSYLTQGWLAPDPPPGHGEHRYVFQLFALDAGTPDPGHVPGRGAVLEAMAGHVIGAGLLVGHYSRGDPALVAPSSADVTATPGGLRLA